MYCSPTGETQTLTAFKTCPDIKIESLCSSVKYCFWQGSCKTPKACMTDASGTICENKAYYDLTNTLENCFFDSVKN